MCEIPKIIYKYKPMITRDDVIRFFDLIANHRIFLPYINQLNDPFECIMSDVSFGTAGSSISRAMDKDHQYVVKRKGEIQILALSEDCCSPQLWAYYCGDYNGVCLCFKTNKTFHDIKKVNYVQNIASGEMVIAGNPADVERLITQRLFLKQEGWQYEHEWRMIFDCNADRYLKYDPDELIAIIIGHKMDSELVSYIKNSLPNDFPIFRTHAGNISGKVRLLPIDYEIIGDGKEPDFIDNTDDLFSATTR